jgi:hypothetical protein
MVMINETAGDNYRKAFEVVSTNPVRYAWQMPETDKGSFMQSLRETYAEKTKEMIPVTGLPTGIFTINPQPPQTPETLGLKSVL